MQRPICFHCSNEHSRIRSREFSISVMHLIARLLTVRLWCTIFQCGVCCTFGEWMAHIFRLVPPVLGCSYRTYLWDSRRGCVAAAGVPLIMSREQPVAEWRGVLWNQPPAPLTERDEVCARWGRKNFLYKLWQSTLATHDLRRENCAQATLETPA